MVKINVGRKVRIVREWCADMRFLIVYDIATSESGAKRLNKTAKICEEYCTRVQNSVFEAILDESELTKLINELERAIDNNYDSVRIYRLPGSSSGNNPITIGRKVEFETLSSDAFIL